MSITVTTPTSELEAVNILLQAIGESPISDLSDGSVVDAVLAKQILSEVSRAVQVRGYHFNTELKFPLVPSVYEKEVAVPTNCLRVVTVYPTDGIDAVHRGSRLYNRTTHSYQFESTVYVDMVVLLPFDELPESARYYITVRAARVFQARTVGSEVLYKFTAQDESMAKAAFTKAEGATGKHNIFNNYATQRILNRR